jgi:hypothetical protein
LVIGDAALTQGELLPTEKAAAAGEGESNISVAAQPLPAT